MKIFLYTKTQPLEFEYAETQIFYGGELKKVAFKNDEYGILTLELEDSALDDLEISDLKINTRYICGVDFSELDFIYEIINRAFKKLPSLEKIILPKFTRKISYQGFADMTNLKSVISQKPLECLSMESFMNCTKLEKLYIDKNTKLGVRALKGCKNLKIESSNFLFIYTIIEAGIDKDNIILNENSTIK